MDGLQLAHLITTEPALAKTNMIMLTSPLHVDVAALSQTGVTEWLTKPVRSSEGGGVAGPRGRVLIVDDNALNRLVAVGMVTALGYPVTP